MELVYAVCQCTNFDFSTSRELVGIYSTHKQACDEIKLLAESAGEQITDHTVREDKEMFYTSDEEEQLWFELKPIVLNKGMISMLV